MQYTLQIFQLSAIVHYDIFGVCLHKAELALSLIVPTLCTVLQITHTHAHGTQSTSDHAPFRLKIRVQQVIDIRETTIFDVYSAIMLVYVRMNLTF